MKMVLSELPLNCFVFKIRKISLDVYSVITVELRHDLLSQDDYF